MSVDEIVEKLLQLQSLLQEVLPAAQALQGDACNSAQIKRAFDPVRKYSEIDKARWRHLAACPDFYLHSKRNTALLIARREGLPAAAADTIRRAI